jgi:hypothetical protein
MAADFSTTGTRQKSTTTNAITTNLIIKSPTIDAGNKAYVNRYSLDDIQPASFTVANCNGASGQAVVTTTASFSNVRPGDPVSGTNIPGGATVLSKQSDTQITLSANITPSSLSNTTLTFTPAVVDATLLAHQTAFTQSGSVLTVTVTTKSFNGTKAYGSADDAVAFSDTSGTVVKTYSFDIDLDTYLTNARIPKSA